MIFIFIGYHKRGIARQWSICIKTKFFCLFYCWNNFIFFLSSKFCMRIKCLNSNSRIFYSI